jgi:RNA polymerase sigma-70 factor (ECF subfamily)
MPQLATGSSIDVEAEDVEAEEVTAVPPPAGPAEDFESFVAGVLPKVLRLAGSLGASRADAEDAAAEALARAYASWGRVGTLEYRVGWVLRTTTNIVYDRARRRRPEQATPPVVLADVFGGFEQRVVERAELVDALRRLSARQRQAVVLHHLGGLSVKEVSEAMRASPNSVKKHLERALVRLRDHLASESPVMPGREKGSDD